MTCQVQCSSDGDDDNLSDSVAFSTKKGKWPQLSLKCRVDRVFSISDKYRIKNKYLPSWEIFSFYHQRITVKMIEQTN